MTHEIINELMKDLDNNNFLKIQKIARELFICEGRDFDLEFSEWTLDGRPIIHRKEKTSES